MKLRRQSIRCVILVAVFITTLLPVGASSARIIGMIELQHDAGPGEPRFGGLSGLEFDFAADRWLAVSDEREGPPRFYTIAIDFDAAEVRSASVSATTFLELPGGEAADLESIRLDPNGERIWYASEGDASKDRQPFIARVRRDGTSPEEFPLPAGFRYDATSTIGVRPNMAVESLAFSIGKDSLWTALEAPLIEDGPLAGASSGAIVRLTEQDYRGEVLRQLAYLVEPIPPSLAAGRRPSNGVSEILMLAPGRLLVLERAGAEFGKGEWRFAVRLFEADVENGDRIDTRPIAQQTFRPVSKRLLFDFNASGIRVDNLEGLAHGRVLADGTSTLVLVSDDNFSPYQSTQLWVLALGAGEPTPNPTYP